MNKLSKGRPKDGKSLKINAGISLEKDLVLVLDAIAKEQGLNRSQLVNQIIVKYLGDQQI
jgi:metal-responsive CopG/Arc/MetJ family transcriptional regulator